MQVIYTGFDKLEVSYKGRVSDEFLAVLEEGKEKASKTHEPVFIHYRGVSFHIRPSGGQGGYAFSCDGGEMLGNWSFKRPKRNDPWGIRIAAGSLMTATYGLDGTRERIDATLTTLGCLLHPRPESIARVDFAIDVLAPGFELNPTNFVLHARTTRSDHMTIETIDSRGHSGRYTSVTVGKMPGKQLIIYDKRLETIQKSDKKVWHAIWNAALERTGHSQLDFTDAYGSAVWRLELRAGKQCLKEAYNVTSWGDLADKLQGIFLDILRGSRYCVPTADTNVSRWPNHQLWDLARNEVKAIDFDRIGYLDERTAIDICRKAKLEVIEHQYIGLAASRVALAGKRVVPTDLLEMATQPIIRAVRKEISEFVDRVEKAAERYAHLK